MVIFLSLDYFRVWRAIALCLRCVYCFTVLHYVMPIRVRQYSCNRQCLSQDFIMEGGIIKQILKYFQVKTLSPVRLFVLQLTSSVMENYVPVGACTVSYKVFL